VSIEAINWALNKVTNVTSTQKAVLIALADRADAQGQCYPSYQDIITRSCASRNAVCSALAALVEKGLISKEPRFNKSTIYTLNLSGTEMNTGDSGLQIDTSSVTQMKNASGIELNTLTIIEPSINHQGVKHGRYKPPEEVDKEVWKDWVAYRRKFKGPTTDRSLALVANKLKPLSHAKQRECVDMAIECGWKSVFPKDNKNDGEFIL
jgi:hypothetical protein